VGYITDVIALLSHCPGYNDRALKRKTVKVSVSFVIQPPPHTHTHVLKYVMLEGPPFLSILVEVIMLYAGISYCSKVYFNIFFFCLRLRLPCA
jgi:hypothetical protein